MKDNLVRNVIIISVVLIGIAISIGFSFAYFSARIVGNEDAKPMSVLAGTMELTFTEGSDTFDLSNAKPGDSDFKTFSVQNTGTLNDEYKYNIKLVGVETNIIKRDLKYILEECEDSTCSSIKEDGVKEEGYINTDSVKNKEMYLAVDIPRPEKEQIQYYKLTIEFQELNIDQSYNKEASFLGKVNVDAEEEAQLYVQEANKPELYQGLIPVTFDKEGNVYVADASKDDWYNYDNNEWGNAVLVDNTKEGVTAKYFDGTKLKEGIAGTEIPMDEIMQMYVWIPRYRYKLFNANNQNVPKQLIEIEFEKGTETTGNVSCTYTDMKDGTVKEDCKNAVNGNWYTHPAFTFGNTELEGFWVGKFEPSDSEDETGRNRSNIGEITILPDKTSMTCKSIATEFFASQKLNDEGNKYNLALNEVDTRIMKNIEWGAVAYLTQSIYGIYKDEKTCNIEGMTKDNCEVWINNTAQGAGTSDVTNTNGGTYTGCVGDTVNAAVIWNEDDGSVAKCKVGNRWNEKGVNASTTGNMYGIYDMSGGAWTFVMGATVNKTGGGLYITWNGFTLTPGQPNTVPESKYYDLYTYDDIDYTYELGHLGDATREMVRRIDNTTYKWNNDYADFPGGFGWVAPWFVRGAARDGYASAGIFAFGKAGGYEDCGRTFRSILSAA